MPDRKLVMIRIVMLSIGIGASAASGADGFTTPFTWATYDYGEHCTQGVNCTDPDGYHGAVFDGRYVYFVPHDQESGRHAEVLRYDTQGAFDDASSWETFDALAELPEVTLGGYEGAVVHQQYVYFVPHHVGYGEVLRYDTGGDFSVPASWKVFDVTADLSPPANGGYHHAVVAGDHIYFAPYYDDGEPPQHHEVLRYDTSCSDPDFNNTACWDKYAPTAAPDEYTGVLSDGTYVYFIPPGHRTFLRYDTSCADGFAHDNCWATYVPPGTAAYVGGVFDMQYLYFASWGSAADTEVLRYDTTCSDPDFDNPDCWDIFDASGAEGGYRGAVFDGRYVYFVPLISHGGQRHGEVLRYDTSGEFSDPASWDTYDYGESAECAADPDCTDPDGYVYGVFDGRHVYFSPSYNGSNVHGEVLRYDTLPDYPIPAVSEWGMLAMVLLVLTAGTLVFMRRRAVQA